MSTLESLGSVQATAAAAQATQNTQTETVSDEVFSSMLSSMLGTSEATSQSQYLLSGLMDGSLQVTDSSKLVSALLSTIDGEGGTDLFSGLDTNTLSQDTITALLDLAQTNEENWMTQLLDSLKTDEAAEEEENDAMLDYYKAMAALGDAQKNILI